MSSKNLPDQLHLIQSGDIPAFNQLFEDQYATLVRTAFRYCQSEAEATDMVQQAFIRFWEKRESIQITDSITGYLRKMVINEALAAQRTKKRRLELAPKQPTSLAERSGEELMMQSELKGAIEEAIESLPVQCGTVFKMSRYESKKYREIADELKISPKTVENHIGKALKLLRVQLAQYLQTLFF